MAKKTIMRLEFEFITPIDKYIYIFEDCIEALIKEPHELKRLKRVWSHPARVHYEFISDFPQAFVALGEIICTCHHLIEKELDNN